MLGGTIWRLTERGGGGQGRNEMLNTRPQRRFCQSRLFLIFQPWRWWQNIPPKHQYITMTLYNSKTHQTFLQLSDSSNYTTESSKLSCVNGKGNLLARFVTSILCESFAASCLCFIRNLVSASAEHTSRRLASGCSKMQQRHPSSFLQQRDPRSPLYQCNNRSDKSRHITGPLMRSALAPKRKT
jgi:hypothetical protein